MGLTLSPRDLCDADAAPWWPGDGGLIPIPHYSAAEGEKEDMEI